MTDVDVHSLVNMIFQGWLISGQPTEEYLRMAARALEERKLAADGIEIVDSRGLTIGR